MPKIPTPKNQWYVAHVLSGQEQKVRENLRRRIVTDEMGDFIFDVLVPTEKVSEVKKGKRSETTRKFYPGYIIINMHLLESDGKLVDQTWYFIRDTPGLLNFAGSKDIPFPMKEGEVESMLAQILDRADHVKPKFTYEPGDSIRVTDGPFNSQNGIVEEVDSERGKLRVSVSIFGRSTPVDLEYWQVERAS